MLMTANLSGNLAIRQGDNVSIVILVSMAVAEVSEPVE